MDDSSSGLDQSKYPYSLCHYEYLRLGWSKLSQIVLTRALTVDLPSFSVGILFFNVSFKFEWQYLLLHWKSLPVFYFNCISKSNPNIGCTSPKPTEEIKKGNSIKKKEFLKTYWTAPLEIVYFIIYKCKKKKEMQKGEGRRNNGTQKTTS